MDNSRAIVSSPSMYSLKNILLMAGISAGYLLLSYTLIGYKSEQLFLIGLVNAFYFISRGTRRFIVGFSIFIIYWVIFDYMKAFPNYWFNNVHIADLYGAEKKLFGISSNGIILTPNEYLRIHAHTAFDILAGVFYLTWVPVPLMFAAFLFYKNRQQFFYFALTFLMVNLLGFVVYYLYPAAPPWYVQHYGFHFIEGTPGNTAQLARFDNYFHAGIFKSIYAKSSNVFAAMPSLHSSYPLIVCYYAFKNKLGFFNIVFLTIMLGIWSAAVYSSHHYVLDVLAGILCATVGILLFNLLLTWKPIATGVNKWIAAAS